MIFIILMTVLQLFESNAEVVSQGSIQKTSVSVPEHLLIALTLEGQLIGISKYTGRVKWKLKQDPVIKVPAHVKGSPLFMPDPQDGSLYGYGGSFSGLKKFPYSIPYLVSSSPCRSSDGLLYTGTKKDTWTAVDLQTGRVLHTLNNEADHEDTCPRGHNSAFYFGRTEYTLSMYDSKSKSRRWNATYFDYTVYKTLKPSDYDIRHFSSSSDGLLVTIDKQKGDVLWSRDLGSPVLSIYDSEDEGGLTRVPCTSMATETLEHLVGQLASVSTRNKFLHSDPRRTFFNTLYIGSSEHGMYALPSWVDETTVAVEPRNTHVPRLPTSNESAAVVTDSPGEESHPPSWPVSVIVGHHEKPEQIQSQLGPNVPLIGDSSEERVAFVTPAPTPAWYHKLDYTALMSTGAFVAFLICLVFLYSLHKRQLEMTLHSNPPSGASSNPEMIRRSQQTSEHSSWGSGGGEGSSGGTAVLEHLANGHCRVNHIIFNPSEELGRGCEGTTVYRGTFDERACAVKRVLPGSFSFVDREVQLLRESDQHPNVIRYYCTAADSQFRYLALELCACTVQDYVSARRYQDLLTPRSLMQQAAAGLQHLHSIGIVHRDIKPHNVLLTHPDRKQNVRVVISDFGLCKKLPAGRASMSHRSGFTGTEGWMAPELMDADNKTTAAVDVFSLGCVFYYVMSEGTHPFGDSFKRQANILAGEYRLDKLENTKCENSLARQLLSDMLHTEPHRRPEVASVLQHPLFWSPNQQLNFLQDVSDRIEKEADDSAVVFALEWGGGFVVRWDWRKYICPALQEDLRRFRSYKGDSVKDLLRAMRNKRHHYNELPPAVRSSLGPVPGGFLTYFTSRFPELLTHVYSKMAAFKHEPLLAQYYACSSH